MKKRTLGVLLALVMALSVLPTMAWADAYWNENGVWNVPEGETVTIDSTVTISGGTVTISGGGTIKRGSCTGAMIEVKSGGKLVIDGVTLDGNKTSGVATKSVIEINAGGEVLMNSGKLCNNIATYGGGVNNYGKFEMQDGEITGNTAKTTSTGGAAGTGGGIRNMGTLIISNGTISNNKAEDGGAGIFNYGGTLEMTGGTITGNTCVKRGGGISHRQDGPTGTDTGIFKISGEPKIYGNYKTFGAETTANNVALITGSQKYNCMTLVGAMGDSAEVWVNVSEARDYKDWTHNFIVVDGYTAIDADLARFKVDDGRVFEQIANGILISHGKVTITGMTGENGTPKVGDTLTAEVFGGVGNLTYQWNRSNGENAVDIQGANGSTYKVTEEDVGYNISVFVQDEYHTGSACIAVNQVGPVPAEAENPPVTPTEPTEPEPAAPEQPTPAPVPGHSGVNRRFPAKTESGTEVTSAKTFDGGVAVYAALALVSAGGMALVQRKRED